MKKTLVFLALTLCIRVYPDAIPVSTLLSSVFRDSDIEAQDERILFLESYPVKFSLFDRLELRVDDRAAFSTQKSFSERLRYSVRMRPTGIRSSMAAIDVYTSTLEHNRDRKEILLNRLLRNRYLLVFELLYRRARLEKYMELSDLYQDRINIINRRAREADFDFDALISSEDDYTDLKLAIVEQQNKIAVIEDQIRYYLPGLEKIVFDTTDLVDIAHVNSRLSTTPIIIDSSNVYLKESLSRLKTAENRYNHESAENRTHLRHIEFTFSQDRYTGQTDRRDRDRDYDIAEAFQFELGFSFPTPKGARPGLNRRKLNLIDDRNRYQGMRDELHERAANLRGEIKTLVQQYELLTERRAEIRTESSLQHIMQRGGEDPLVMLKVRESIIESDVRLEKIRYDIYKKYIRMMDITGMLSQKPLRNVLSVKQEPLQ